MPKSERMQDKNTCKFVSGVSGDGISILNFVYEKQMAQRGVRIMPQNYIIHIVTSGTGFLKTSSGRAPLQTGSIFFAFPSVPFEIEGEDLNYMYITFNGTRCDELTARFGISPSQCVFDGYGGLVSMWESAIVRANEKNLDLVSEAVLLYSLGDMAPREQSNDEKLIGSIIKYIEDNFRNPETTLSSTADALDYSDKYISRIFKKKMNITFSQYLKNARIKHAVFLMEQGITAIKNVSLLSGYTDQFYFSSVFKSVTGLSPTEYVARIQTAVSR